ncbi:methylmalonyl-CoA mutase family protein [Bacillus sp. DJP31]|uniref:methylmalonyl-CoA mutase family protein n=1 Tax=Bacillus sp. DJP31 TaxID=3409789 RepID=UPI003BB68354
MTKKQSTNNWFADLEKFSIPSYEEWEQVAISSLKGKPIEKLNTSTYEGITLKPVYTSSGARHKQPQSTKQHLDDNCWDICQEIYATTAKEAIVLVKQAIELGQTSVNLQLRTQDTPRGLKINNKSELFQLLDTIPLEKVKLFINTRLQQSLFISALSMYQQNSSTPLEGVVGSDPIAEWVLKGQLPRELPTYYDEMSAILKEYRETCPGIKTILVQSHPYHNGGANAVQELAYTLSVAIEYVSQCLERGISIDEVAPQFAFSFSVGSNLFMEIAKLRAANYLWASIVNEFGGNKKSQKIWMHAKTSSTTKTKLDPYVNMLRSTGESFAAVIGGANSIHTSTFDEAFQSATPFSERNARNIQSILMKEAHLSRVIDPSSGSWYVENLTKELAEKAWEQIQIIEKKGGITKALRENFVQDEIKKSRDIRFDKMDHRKERMVGVNMYANIVEEEIISAENQVSTLESNVESSRPSNLQLDPLQSDYFARIKDELSKGTDFLSIQEAIKGSTQEQSIESILTIRWSMKVEYLRDNASRYSKNTGEKLAVHIINLGDMVQLKPRIDFIQGFFEVGGFHVTQSTSTFSMEEIKGELKTRREQVFVICGQDETFSEIGRDVIELVKGIHPACHLFIAGKLSSETLKVFQRAGLNDCIHMDTNCFELVVKLQSKMEGLHEKA